MVTKTQFDRVEKVMLDGKWHTITALANKLGIPETSASARIRDLRKPVFGGYTVERERQGTQYRYRLLNT